MILCPTNGNVLVKDVEDNEEVTSEGGIVLPGKREEKKRWSQKAQVIRSSSRKYKPGNLIVYGHFYAAQVDEDHFLDHEAEIQGFYAEGE